LAFRCFIINGWNCSFCVKIASENNELGDDGVTTKEFSPKEILVKAEKLLEGSKVIFLATNGSYGHPDLRAMSPLSTSGVAGKWFGTAKTSSKVLEISNDEKAIIYTYSSRPALELRLWGNISIFEKDRAAELGFIAALNDELRTWIEGDDAVLLKFSAVSGLLSNKNGKNYLFEI
jgi:general stress protein 26